MARATTTPIDVRSHWLVEEIVIAQTWRDRLEALAGRRRDVYLIAGIVGAVLLFAIFTLGHRSRVAIAAPARGEAVAPVVTPSGTTPSTIYVHVAGAVRRPGLYRLPAGTRVAQAIETAGGPVAKADLDLLNLAEILADAAKVDVPYRGEAFDAPATMPPTPGGAPVDLNTADELTLESIPGIGPVTATAILQKRTELGRFDSFDQLLDVTGIGPATLEAIRPYVTI